MVEIALATAKGSRISADEIARRHEISGKFLEGILTDLRKSKVILSHRGSGGGYELARDADSITIADIVRMLDGPLAAVKGKAPESIKYKGSTSHLTEVWIATRVALRDVLENISISDVVSGNYNPEIIKMLKEKDAWKRRK
jgi:Rrf2 family protein